jgi:lipopolysaccharide biosynthesis glycosyltransferase
MPIDIAFSLNRTLQTPLLVVINSILKNASGPSDNNLENSPDPIRFNILVPPGDQSFFEDQLKAAFSDPSTASLAGQNAIFRVREFTPPDFLKHYLDSKFNEQRPDRRISRYMQYARFFLKPMFPDVSRVIYLDGDTLVLGDVRELFAQGSRLTPETYLAAVPQLFPAMFYFSNPFKIWSDLRQFKNTFNSGVLLTDLSFWSEQTYDELRYYLSIDAKNNYRLYNLGDETVFNLIFKRTYLELDQKWNCWGYGQPHWISRLLTLKCNLKTVKIIHWSGGHHKPWHSDRVTYSALWRSYIPKNIAPAV